MRVTVEVIDLKQIDYPTMKILKRLSFGEGGWMTSCMRQILEGFALRSVWVSDGDDLGYVETKRVPLAYNRAHALIARDDDGEIVGWAMVRHPQKRTKVRNRVYDYEQHEWVTKYEYGGRRPDFMVYIKAKYRKQRVARQLLLVAFNNFGRVDAYPHDKKSDRFYGRNARFVTAHNTNDFSTAKYKTREVFN